MIERARTSNAQDLSSYVERTGYLRSKDTGLRFRIEVTDARYRYGQLDFRIVPYAGTGEVWVSGDRVELD